MGDSRLFCFLFAGRRCLCPGWHSFNRRLPSAFQLGYQCARSSSKVPITLMGSLLMYVPRLTLAQLRPTLWSTTDSTCRRDLKASHRPHGKIADMLASTLACTTAADTSVNYSAIREIVYVLQRPEMFPSLLTRLPGLSNALAWTLARTTAADAPVNNRRYVQQRPEFFPSPRWENG